MTNKNIILFLIRLDQNCPNWIKLDQIGILLNQMHIQKVVTSIMRIKMVISFLIRLDQKCPTFIKLDQISPQSKNVFLFIMRSSFDLNPRHISNLFPIITFRGHHRLSVFLKTNNILTYFFTSIVKLQVKMNLDFFKK